MSEPKSVYSTKPVPDSNQPLPEEALIMSDTMNPIATAVKGAIVTPEDSAIVLTANGLVLNGEPTDEQWSETGKALGRMERGVQWLIGDWYNKVPSGDKKLACEEAGLNYQTARIYGTVADAFQMFTRVNISFSHHKAVMGLPLDEATVILNKALEENWSVSSTLNAARGAKALLKSQAEPGSTSLHLPPASDLFSEEDKSPEQQAHESNLKLFGSLDNSKDESPVEASPTTDIFGDSPKESTPEPSVDSDLPQGIPEPSEGLNTPVAEAHRVSLSVGSEFEMESFAEDLADSVLVQAETETLSPEDMPAVTDWESGEGTEWHRQYPFHTVADSADANGVVFREDSSKSYKEQCRDFLVLVSAVQRNVEACPLEPNYPYEMIDSILELQAALRDLAGNLVRANAAKTA
jgi:hypothetical protein